jgi:acyl dehydratase
MFDEIAVGSVELLGSHTFSEEEIIRFALKFDPQPFHIDPEAAKQSHFGGLIASGWQTGSWWMRLRVERWQTTNAERAAKGLPALKNGPSGGYTNLVWPKPVYAGDTVTYSTEIVGKRASASRPEWGLLFSRNTGVNQNGVLVFAFDGSVFAAR